LSEDEASIRLSASCWITFDREQEDWAGILIVLSRHAKTSSTERLIVFEARSSAPDVLLNFDSRAWRTVPICWE
jgi:hypothetical protein